ncbi:MAG: hypothetical protein LW832_10015 [Parachlamydia sp.]|jgi:hypothetical protein|nr:hypothetical protein [Parachlamydia sp.]
MSHFPVLSNLNQYRRALHNDSHLKPSEDLLSTKTLEHIGKWMLHKPLTVIALPLNFAAVGIGSAAALASGGLIGSLKVATFAISLGRVKPAYGSGFIWFSERVASAAKDIFKILVEITYDLYDIGYQAMRAVRWTVCKAFERLKKGIENACERESGFTGRWQCLFPHILLNQKTASFRINPEALDRSFKQIFTHTFYSIFNIPVCAATATAATLSAAANSIIFGVKAVAYAGTNCSIPIPTYVGLSVEIAGTAVCELCQDTYDTVSDLFITMYKISSAIGCRNVLAKVRDIVHYIPEAFIS